MRHLLFAIILCISSSSLFAEKIIFVKQNGSGLGSSWSDATGDLVSALFLAESGEEIWIASGTYFPTTDRNRNKSFIIPSGVKIYGGFAGHETNLQERVPEKNRTILSGDIGELTVSEDNSSTIIYLRNADENTLLDGLIIINGVADGNGPTADRRRCGAALFIDGSDVDGNAKPTIQNCIFQNNYARDGGAVYLNGKAGTCVAIFKNCLFSNNKADLDGGAVFNDGRHGGTANPVFLDCTFEGNEGNYGGAICNYGGRGESSPKLRNCVFSGNAANLRGGAIFNMDIEGVTKPSINDCQFVNNKAVSGSGVYTFSQPKRTNGGKKQANYKIN